MAETTKKAKAPSKKAEAKKVDAPTAEPVKKSAAKKTAEAAVAAPLKHDEVAKLAHHYYSQRGHQHGQHVDDWFRAEQELRGKAS